MPGRCPALAWCEVTEPSVTLLIWTGGRTWSLSNTPSGHWGPGEDNEIVFGDNSNSFCTSSPLLAKKHRELFRLLGVSVQRCEKSDCPCFGPRECLFVTSNTCCPLGGRLLHDLGETNLHHQPARAEVLPRFHFFFFFFLNHLVCMFWKCWGIKLFFLILF